ncbi:hypothetical protein EDB83DRAFT_2326167 [Lactarius deliciosus]|nr:hypothetical protein EDB83DRAFT_2326167 [Lactarius deliciosus]
MDKRGPPKLVRMRRWVMFVLEIYVLLTFELNDILDKHGAMTYPAFIHDGQTRARTGTPNIPFNSKVNKTYISSTNMTHLLILTNFGGPRLSMMDKRGSSNGPAVVHHG